MNPFKRIIATGIKGDHSENTNGSIRTANFVNFLFFLASIPFGVIVSIFYPTIVWVYFMFAGTCLINFFFNKIGCYNLSRLWTCFGLTSAATLFCAYIQPDGQPVFSSLFAIEIIFFTLPWVLFSMEEKKSLFLCLAFAAATVLGFPTLNNWFSLEADVVFFQRGMGIYLCYATCLLCISSCLFYLLFTNHEALRKNFQLLADSEVKSKTVRENEQKLNASIAEIQKSHQDDERRAWASDGIAQFSVLMRQETDLQHLYDQLILQTVKYVKANQGGLYVVQGNSGEEKFIELVAMYAYDRKKYRQQRFDIGQGLIGQCYLEKAKVVLTDIPSGYVQITSGLGEASPTCILLLPLLINDEVEGILELASFRVFEPHTIDFLEKLCENIASAIRNQKINARTRALLAESQQQAEEMRAAEEEMRQNMEEMQAIHEQQARLEKELQEKLEELEEAKYEIETVRSVEKARADEQIEKRNQLMRQAMEKFKQKEQELLRKIQSQEEELTRFQPISQSL